MNERMGLHVLSKLGIIIPPFVKIRGAHGGHGGWMKPVFYNQEMGQDFPGGLILRGPPPFHLPPPGGWEVALLVSWGGARTLQDKAAAHSLCFPVTP